MAWRRRVALLLAGGLLTLAAISFALFYGAWALHLAFQSWFVGAPALAAGAVALAFLLLMALFWLVASWALRPRRRIVGTAPNLAEEAADVARRHPLASVSAAFAMGFASGQTAAADQLLAELLRQASQGRR